MKRDTDTIPEHSNSSTQSGLGAPRFGPLVAGETTTFRLYAPSAKSAELVIDGRRRQPMQRGEDGFLLATAEKCGPGTRYRFRIGDLEVPDFASRQQDGGTNGWSVVRAPLNPTGRLTTPRAWHEALVAEVHTGAATPEGTFAALAGRLEHFRDAGYTAIELMPVNAFPGSRNWGYDGTLVFAPAEAYGTPADLKALVDRVHTLGLSIVLDVVYNHFGDVDNFAERYLQEWFDPSVETPWGPGIDTGNPMVRRFYYENAAMWLGEYDFDGLRFDSVHEIKGDQRDRFLGRLAEEARRIKPRARLILENVSNSTQWLERDEANEPKTYIAQWNDDMHHVLDFIATGEGTRTGYDDPSKDPYADLEKALAQGFVHDAGEEEDESDGRTRGGPAAQLPPDAFITYVQNHDQIGNRSDLKRLPDRTSPETLDFVHFVKFLAPQIPLCFMGDEGHLRMPFPYFFELTEADAARKRDDRYEQLRTMFGEPDIKEGDLPDPNDPATFGMAKYRWEDYGDPEHRDSLERFRELAGVRRELVWPLTATPWHESRSARQGNCLIINWAFEAGTLTMALNPTASPADIACLVLGDPVSAGTWSQHGDVLRLGPWTAVAWSDRTK